MRAARERILDALLERSYQKGLPTVSIEEVIEQAQVSREEFESHFSSKEDCAIAAFERGLTSFREAVLGAYESEERWPDSLRAAAWAGAQWMEDNPRQIRFGAVELLWVGELAQTSREAAFRSFIRLIDAGREVAADPDAIPPHTAEQVVGAAAQLMTKHTHRGPYKPLEFVPETMYLAVLPYLGEEAARRELTIPPPEPPGGD